MSRTSITLKSKLLLGLVLTALLTLIVGVTGVQQLRAVSHQMAAVRQINECMEAAHRIEAYHCRLALDDQAGLGAEQTVDVWKKAKDKFLKEIKRLSQTPGLGEQERQVVREIEDAWKNYDISFNKYIMARGNERDAWAGQMQRLVTDMQGPEGLGGVSTTAEASVERTIHQAQIILILITVLAVVVGVLASLLLARQVACVFQAILRRLESASARNTSSAAPEVAIDSQIKDIEHLVQDLNQLLDGRTGVEEKEPETRP